MKSWLPQALVIFIMLGIATLALSACAPVTLDLPPIVNRDWP
jgi:hypothetical protein